MLKMVAAKKMILTSWKSPTDSYFQNEMIIITQMETKASNWYMSDVDPFIAYLKKK